MKPLRLAQVSLTISVLSLFLAITAFTPGCAQLDPAGVYHGDKILYTADASTVTSYQILDTFTKWDRDNEALLKAVPGIHAAADNIRANAPGWFKTAYALRDAYKADPSEPNKDALESALSVINQAVKEALLYLSKYGPGSPAAGLK